jgi:hypothetical protein
MHACMDLCIYAYVLVCVCVVCYQSDVMFTRRELNMLVSFGERVCMYVYVCVCMYVCTYMHACMDLCIYAYVCVCVLCVIKATSCSHGES